jgi:hypothetical protein
MVLIFHFNTHEPFKLGGITVKVTTNYDSEHEEGNSCNLFNLTVSLLFEYSKEYFWSDIIYLANFCQTSYPSINLLKPSGNFTYDQV